MVYFVIKTIKGHRYLYEQQTWRDGNHVRTLSRYIGPEGQPPGGGGEKAENNSNDKEHGKTGGPDDKTSSMFRAVQGMVPGQKTTPGAGTVGGTQTLDKTPPTRAFNDPVSLDIGVRLENYAISETALWEEKRGLLRRLEVMGLDTGRFPTIRVRHGLTVAHKRKAFGEGYVVTLPRGGSGNRTRFKREFSRALMRASFDMVREQHPQLYLRIAGLFDESYRKTQQALTTYILNSNDRRRRFKAIALMWWGRYAQVHRSPLKPESLGVIDASRRKDWVDEVVQIGGELQRRGYGAVRKTYLEGLHRAREELETAKAERDQYFKLSPRRRRANRRILRADARVKANEEMLRKVEWLKHLFRF